MAWKGQWEERNKPGGKSRGVETMFGAPCQNEGKLPWEAKFDGWVCCHGYQHLPIPVIFLISVILSAMCTTLEMLDTQVRFTYLASWIQDFSSSLIKHHLLPINPPGSCLQLGCVRSRVWTTSDVATGTREPSGVLKQGKQCGWENSRFWTFHVRSERVGK